MKKYFTFQTLPLLLAMIFLTASNLQAQTPNATLSIQGILKKADGSAVEDGPKSLTFTLYKSDNGADNAYSETIDVETSGGVYSTVLGLDPMHELDAPFDQVYYLGVKIGSSGQELTPRPLLTHAPYAMSLLGKDNKFPSTGIVSVTTPVQNKGLLKLNATSSAKGDKWWMGFGHGNSTGYLADANDRARVGVRIKDGGAGELFFTAGNAGSQKEGMRVTALGNVEVGDTMLLLNNQYQLQKPRFNVRADTGFNKKAVFNVQNNAGEDIMTVFNDKHVVIRGTNNGDDFPLKIQGYLDFYLYNPVSNQIKNRGFALQPQNELQDYSNDTKRFSLSCGDGVVATLFAAWSDNRIKNIVGRSKPAEDLKILQKISITDYTLKDWISNGNNVTKKVIAQEVEEVYPQAVSKSVGVVPDIYQHAQIKAGRVEVPNDLKPGEQVQLIFGSRREIVEVLSADAGSFTVSMQEEGPVFVYGREVKDFRSVDYDALITLNISATQELSRRLELLENENAALKAENAALSAKQDASAQLLNGFEARLKLLEAQTIDLNGSKTRK